MHRFLNLMGSRAGKGLLALLALGVMVVAESPSSRAAGAEATAADSTHYTGVLKTGIMAIGGETTGVTLNTGSGGVYELDLGANAELKKQAEALSGRKVAVVGDLTVRAGVEVKERRVIAVKSLRAAD